VTAHAPCQVSIGPTEHLLDHTVSYLQQQLCPTRKEHPQSRCRCAICNGIAEQQSAFITWLSPTKEYVLKDLDQLFATIRFSLEPGTQHFFVIQEAQLLTPTCANRLLKVLEEPPAGYSFLLLTTDYQALLPTIKSRSTILHEEAHDSPALSGLISLYSDPKKLLDPQGFDRTLKAAAPTLPQARLLVQQLAISIDYTKFSHPRKVKEFLVLAQRNLPQPGGGTYFLRWIYMNLHAIEAGVA
jgi:hypothetical protein